MVAAARNPCGTSGRSSSRLQSSARREKSRPRSRRIRVERSDDEDDGVHGERMKPLVSCCVNTANTSLPRKPLSPLVARGGTSMDLLLMALDSCSSGENGLGSDQSKDLSREREEEQEEEDEEEDNKSDDKENSLPSCRKGKPADNHDVPATSTLPMFANAAANVASRWLELLHLDLKGRLAALKRSRRNVRGVIVSGHIGRDEHWMRMFLNMDSTLAAEGAKLENSIRKVLEMQRFCIADDNFGIAGRLLHFTPHQATTFSTASANDSQLDRALARAACAGAICSTASFALKQS